MKVGDLVRISIVYTGHGAYAMKDTKLAMIVEGPNEVGNIRVLLSDGSTSWKHCSEVEYLPKKKGYLKE